MILGRRSDPNRIILGILVQRLVLSSWESCWCYRMSASHKWLGGNGFAGWNSNKAADWAARKFGAGMCTTLIKFWIKGYPPASKFNYRAWRQKQVISGMQRGNGQGIGSGHSWRRIILGLAGKEDGILDFIERASQLEMLMTGAHKISQLIQVWNAISVFRAESCYFRRDFQSMPS